MKIYNYSDEGEYLGESIAVVSPLDGVPLIPRNATTIEPPVAGNKKVCKFNGETWELVDDFRGETWYLKNTREPFKIDFIGEVDSAKYQPSPHPLTQEEKWDNIRIKRDQLLSDSDWTQLSDSPADKAAWALYRQSLRDIPQDFESPEEVVWPENP